MRMDKRFVWQILNLPGSNILPCTRPSMSMPFGPSNCHSGPPHIYQNTPMMSGPLLNRMYPQDRPCMTMRHQLNMFPLRTYSDMMMSQMFHNNPH